MLRFNFLAVLSVGLLAACGSNGPGVGSADGGTSLARQSQALTTITRRLDWDGLNLCFNCNSSDAGTTDTTHACSDGTGNWNSGVKTFSNPIPAGGKVLSVEAKVYGRNISNTQNAGVDVQLNGVSIGSYTTDKNATCALNNNCGEAKTVSSSPDGGIGLGLVNTLKLTPASTYCVAHVELSFTVEQDSFQVDPTDSLDFGKQKVGTTSAAEPVTVRNTGDTVLQITDVSTNGSTIFSVTPPIPSAAFPVTVLPGGNHVFSVKFKPDVATTVDAGTLTLTTNHSGRPTETITLLGTGTENATDVSRTSIGFGEYSVGATTPKQEKVTVTNVGAGTLNLSHSVSGDGGTSYVVTPNTLSLAVGASGDLTVAFNPQASGELPATLTLTGNAAGGAADGGTAVETIPITLSGKGVQPAYTVDSSLKDFGEQRVSTDTHKVTVVVTNSGTGTLKLTGIAVTGAGFSVTPATLDVAEGLTGNIDVTFAPTSPGLVNGNLTFTSNKVGTGASASIAVRGYGVQPAYTVDTALRDFGERRVSTDTHKVTVVVTNSGTGTLKLTGIAVTGAGFSVTPATLDVAEGLTGNIDVTFAPTSPGLVNGNLTFTSNKVGSDASASIPVKGYGVQPAHTVDTSPRDFGRQAINTASAEQTVVVTNSGTGTLKLRSIAISGAGAGAFSTPPSTLDVAEGQSGSIGVTFTPRLEGLFEANLTFTSNQVGSSPISIRLSGTGVRSAAEVSPEALNFGSQRVGIASAPQKVTVRNSGASTLAINSIAIQQTGTPAPFNIDSTAAFELLPGATKDLFLTFTPGAAAAITGQLNLTTSDPQRPSIGIPLSGTGVQPNVEFPASLVFDEQRVSTAGRKAVRISNTGSGSITFTDVNVVGSSVFTVVSPTIRPFTVNAGSYQDVTVEFVPTLETESTATLELLSGDAAYRRLEVALSGKGVMPTLGVSTRTLAFGPQQVGLTSTPRVVTLSNTRTGTLRITSIVTTGPFVVTPNQPFPLPQGGTPQELSVTFSPIAYGPATGSVTLRTNDPTNDPVTIDLSGNGVNLIDVTPSSASINFGNVPKGTTVEREVTFTNKGTGTIKIDRVSFVSSQFGYTAPGVTFPVDLKPGNSSLTLKVTFSPTAAGDVAGKISLVSNADNSPHEVALSGRGTEARMQVTLPNRQDPNQTAIDFGNVAVNSTASEAVEIKNIGDATLRLSNAYVSPTGTPFNYVGSTTHDIAPQQSITVQVTFRPVSNNSSNANLVLESNAANAPMSLLLLGTGSSPAIALSETSLTFAAQRVKNGTQELPVIITNTGKVNLEITGFSFTNTDFSVTSPTTYPTIAPTQQARVSVKFNPTKRGTVTGTLNILSNATVPAPAVSLSGVGLDGLSFTTPGEVKFLDPVEVRAIGVQQTVTLTNKGDYPLTLETATLSDPSEASRFLISGFRTGLVLQPEESSAFFVTFVPQVRGYQRGTVLIETDSQLNRIHNLSVSGTGVGPEVQFTTPTVNFGKANVGVTLDQSLTINNIGEKQLRIWGVSFENKTGTDGGTSGIEDMALDFDVVDTVQASDGGTPTSVFPLVVDPNVPKSVRLKFTPSAVGIREAQAVIHSNASAAKADVRGEGTSQLLSVSPTSVRLEGVLIGGSANQTITITNDGTGPITIKDVRLGGAGVDFFTKTHPSLPVTLAPRVGTLAVSVTFVPTQAQPSASAQLVVEPQSATAPSILVSLVGVGVLKPISVEPELSFGQQLLNTTSRARTLHITNNTDTDLTLPNVAVDGAGCSQFEPEAMGTLVLKPRTPQSLNVTFTPQSETEVNCRLKLYIAELGRDFEVALRGKGIPKVISVSPAELDFGGVRIGSDKLVQPLTIMNLSSDTITLGMPEVKSRSGASFIFEGDSLRNVQLAPGVPVIVNVGYQPTVETTSETVLSFGTTTPLKPRAVDVLLKGRATRRVLSSDLPDLDFGWVNVGNKKVEPKVITLTNKSTQLQRVVVMLKAGEDAPFILDTKALSGGIPPEGTASFTVDFKPQQAGDAANEVQVYLEGEAAPEVQIPVKGIGRSLTGTGSGCSCGTTEAGSAGMLMLLALVGLGSRRRRRE